jgi:hypothetical protein
MYEILFARMLDGRARVERVFQLNGKRAVIEACSQDQADRDRRRLYIIDGDYDLLSGKPAPNLKYLYRLNVYSSENLVLTETSVLEVAYESSTNDTKEDVKVKLDYETFINELVQYLIPLFVLNAALHSMASDRGILVHIPTTNYSVFRLGERKGKGFSVVQVKVERRIEDVIKELVQDYGFNRTELDALIAQIQAKLPKPTAELTKYISAKTHIFPLLRQRLRGRFSYMGSLEQLKVQLARHCELDVDPGLLAAVTATSKIR